MPGGCQERLGTRGNPHFRAPGPDRAHSQCSGTENFFISFHALVILSHKLGSISGYELLFRPPLSKSGRCASNDHPLSPQFSHLGNPHRGDSPTPSPYNVDKFLCHAFGMVCEQSHIKVPSARFARFAHKLAYSTLMWLCSQTICLSACHKNLSGAAPPNPCRRT